MEKTRENLELFTLRTAGLYNMGCYILLAIPGGHGGRGVESAFSNGQAFYTKRNEGGMVDERRNGMNAARIGLGWIESIIRCIDIHAPWTSLRTINDDNNYVDYRVSYHSQPGSLLPMARYV